MSVIPFPTVSTSCSGRTMPGLIGPEQREQALAHCYSLARQAGADPLTANSAVHDLAKYLDAIDAEYRADLSVIRRCMERTS